MFRFDDELKVYLHRDPVDFRCGINSLSILVEQAMHLSPPTPGLNFDVIFHGVHVST